MSAIVDLARRRAATAYASADLDTLLGVALDALSDLDAAYAEMPVADRDAALVAALTPSGQPSDVSA